MIKTRTLTSQERRIDCQTRPRRVSRTLKTVSGSPFLVFLHKCLHPWCRGQQVLTWPGPGLRSLLDIRSRDTVTSAAACIPPSASAGSQPWNKQRWLFIIISNHGDHFSPAVSNPFPHELTPCCSRSEVLHLSVAADRSTPEDFTRTGGVGVYCYVKSG